MKKTIAVLGLAAVSNAIHNNYVDDEYFGLGIDIKSKVQTADVSRSHRRINVNMKDDADNELHNYFSMPHNKGDIQFNDYTVKGSKKDDADDELFLGIKINNKVQTANANHAHGMININMKDDADNELHSYYSMPHNKGNIQFNDYSKAKDDELFGLGIDIKSKVQTADVSRSRGRINVNMKDDADDDELFGLGVNIKSKVQTADVSHSHGRINVNMQDDADDEFYAASAGKGNHKDEIELLRSLLKIATQDKNGNVIVDGVKIGKIPQAKEHTKPLKNNSSSKAQPELPKRKFLAF